MPVKRWSPVPARTDSMRALTSVPASNRRVLLLLWLSWGTLLWAGLSMYLGSAVTRLPHTVELLMILSGAIAFVGGCLGAIFLFSAARTRQNIAAGAVSTLGNFAYLWWYAGAVYHQ